MSVSIINFLCQLTFFINQLCLTINFLHQLPFFVNQLSLSLAQVISTFQTFCLVNSIIDDYRQRDVEIIKRKYALLYLKLLSVFVSTLLILTILIGCHQVSTQNALFWRAMFHYYYLTLA